MKLREVPPSLVALQCLRCRDYMAVDPEWPPARRREVATEHHLYLCTCPTPNVALWRSIGFPDPRPDQR